MKKLIYSNSTNPAPPVNAVCRSKKKQKKKKKKNTVTINIMVCKRFGDFLHMLFIVTVYIFFNFFLFVSE